MSSQRIQLRDGSSIDVPNWYYKQARAAIGHKDARIILTGATPDTKRQDIVTFNSRDVTSVSAVDADVAEVTFNPASVVVNVAAPNVNVEPPQVTLQMPDQQALTVERDPASGLIQTIRPA